jgi:hypothetical protein
MEQVRIMIGVYLVLRSADSEAGPAPVQQYLHCYRRTGKTYTTLAGEQEQANKCRLASAGAIVQANKCRRASAGGQVQVNKSWRASAGEPAL